MAKKAKKTATKKKAKSPTLKMRPVQKAAAKKAPAKKTAPAKAARGGAAGSIYDRHLDKNPANYQPLTPLHFIERAAATFPNKLSAIHGKRRFTWQQTYDRARRLGSALARRGIKKNDTVSVMLPNIPEMVECHFGVPMCGAVLGALNTRLDAATIAFILEHSETKLLIADREFAPTVKAALAQLGRKIPVIDVNDSEYAGPGDLLGTKDYEALLAEGDKNYQWHWPKDEWDAISLNYTSGTTGNPKGVVYHHRGAYLGAVGNLVTWSMPQQPVYLWTLPMFHCNGWTFPWAIACMAGINVCLRRVEAKAVYDAIADHKVSHFCGAPIVLAMVTNAKANERRDFDHVVNIMTAAAPPPPAVLEAIEKMGFRVTHVYGLTEVYGPATVCAWDTDWDKEDPFERARLKARQGVRYAVEEGLMVADAKTLKPTPPDAKTMGEVFMRGNLTMKGYLKNPKATDDAFKGGWFHTGDLGVTHLDGYIELRDRSKDIIISGGENISTIEVEQALYKHPAVLEAAVVGRPDEKWGETPCAFVVLREGFAATEAELLEFCRNNMARYKVPKSVVFGDLPKTSTGKVQKFVLRDKAKAL